MKGRIFAGLFLACLLIAAGGGAQNPSGSEKPVWTMEFIKVKPGMFGQTLGYLDDNWIRAREEAKRQGAVLSYHRITEALLVTPGSKSGDQNSMVLLTEYKNPATYFGREKLFASIRKQLPKNTSGIIVRPLQQEDLYETVNTRVFVDYSVLDNTRFQLLSKN
jgi:hypothetical protein